MKEKHLIYFEEMVSAFEEILMSSPELRNITYYRFAGLNVRIRCAGNKLSSLHEKVFNHLKLEEVNISEKRFDLTIDLWDQVQTRFPCPVDLISDESAKLRTVTASADSRIVADQDIDTSIFFDRKVKRIIASFVSADKMNNYDLSKPFNRLLALWYRDMNVEVIHSSMISKNRKGILFLGEGGSGKTTSALSCLNDGFNYLGDDHIGLTEVNHTFVGYSLYASVLIYENHFKQFPQLQKFELQKNMRRDEKSIIYFSNGYLNKIDNCAEIALLLLPKVVDSNHANFRKAKKSETLLAAAPSSLRLQISPNKKAFDTISHLVDKTPSYCIEVGKDLDEIPKCVNEIINL
jgi:hypothetical protein